MPFPSATSPFVAPSYRSCHHLTPGTTPSQDFSNQNLGPAWQSEEPCDVVRRRDAKSFLRKELSCPSSSDMPEVTAFDDIVIRRTRVDNKFLCVEILSRVRLGSTGWMDKEFQGCIRSQVDSAVKLYEHMFAYANQTAGAGSRLHPGPQPGKRFSSIGPGDRRALRPLPGNSS